MNACFSHKMVIIVVVTVMRSTTMNTSKEINAYSDFPPSAEAPAVMKHEDYVDYLEVKS